MGKIKIILIILVTALGVLCAGCHSFPGIHSARVLDNERYSVVTKLSVWGEQKYNYPKYLIDFPVLFDISESLRRGFGFGTEIGLNIDITQLGIGLDVKKEILNLDSFVFSMDAFGSVNLSNQVKCGALSLLTIDLGDEFALTTVAGISTNSQVFIVFDDSVKHVYMNLGLIFETKSLEWMNESWKNVVLSLGFMYRREISYYWHDYYIPYIMIYPAI